LKKKNLNQRKEGALRCGVFLDCLDIGCDKIYYQGAKKVASVLAFGILSICIHQSLKLVT